MPSKCGAIKKLNGWIELKVFNGFKGRNNFVELSKEMNLDIRTRLKQGSHIFNGQVENMVSYRLKYFPTESGEYRM